MSAKPVTGRPGRVPTRWGRHLPYDHRLRRQGRGVRRLLRATLDPQFHPQAPVARAFWFDGIANFGDQLTPWLLGRCGIFAVQSPASEADLCAVGSVLEMLPPTFSGAVWGSGLLTPRRLPLPDARWLAVRGRLTRELVGAPPDLPLGDPGILVSRFLPRPEHRPWDVGVVPHHAQEDDPWWNSFATRFSGHARVIAVRRPPGAVVRDIAACRAIVTSSLHGLVVADSFGIPAVWVGGEPPLTGGDFKFHDYTSAMPGAVVHKVERGDLQAPGAVARLARAVPADQVSRLQADLLTALQQAPMPRVSAAQLWRGLARRQWIK